MKITFTTVSATALEYLAKAGNQINEQYQGILTLKLYDATKVHEGEKLIDLIGTVETSDLVFVDLMGSPSQVIKLIYEALEKTSGHIVPYGNSARQFLRLGKFTAESMKLENQSGENKSPDMKQIKKMKAVAEVIGTVLPGKMRDAKNYSTIMKYFKVANLENMTNLLCFLMKEYGGIKNISKLKPPKEFPSVGICDPQGRHYFDDLEDYLANNSYDNKKPNLAILYYAQTYPVDTAPVVSKVKDKLESFANVIPVAISGDFKENEKKLRRYLMDNSILKPDLILNFMSFRLGAGPMGGDFQAGVRFLEEMDVPYFHPFFMTRKKQQDWLESVQGCTPSEVLISVMLPELDGAIETYPIAAMSSSTYDKNYHIETEGLSIIEDRLEKLSERCKKYLQLRSKSNRDKKVAIIGYNYPPGEGDLFGGAFLDTFASVEKILAVLRDEGYSTHALKKEELMAEFTAGKIVNSGKYSDTYDGAILYDAKTFKKCLEKSSTKEEMQAIWGKAPGSIMVDEEEKFIIPGKKIGNIFLGLQPTKGNHEEPEKNYHDKSIPPHYQYQAFYHWLREDFKADVILHLGTHGTLEFLKGKECGMSGNCYPDQLLGDIPHIYLYYCGNPAEAVVAKRRSYANIVSYQPPVFRNGGLHGDYKRLNLLIHQYKESLSVNPAASKDILRGIKKLAEDLKLPMELEEIEKELHLIQMSLIPYGLHIFGKGYSHEEAVTYVHGYLKSTQNGIRGLNDLLMDCLQSSEEHEAEGKYLLEFYLKEEKLPKKDYIHSANQDLFLNTLSCGKTLYKKAIKNDELKGLIKAISGQYNQAKLAGDIYRSPNILPSGYNLYQFDPRQVPTQIAYERGVKVAESTIDLYRKDQKQYPLSTGVILWGLETSRTQGEAFSQILVYLGVRIPPRKNEWETTFELIPIEELGRPRIDVTVNICGFFRDMFPNLIELLNDVFHQLYEADESDDENYFKRNSKIILETLMDKGYGEEEAKDLALARIFGPEEGCYGTNLTGIIESKNWSEEDQLGHEFMNSLRYVYNRNYSGKKIEGLYEENLKSVDIVSQVRSNQEYEITDLDHYYEFFGGLAKSVEMVKGEKVQLYISDTTRDNILTESVEKSIARGIRTRTTNPKWIEGMLEHSYHGVQKISKVFENVMGLASTTNSVEDWIYDDFHKTYVEDVELRQKMIESNPYSYMDILEQMMEYKERGYWNAHEEQIEKIKEVYLSIEDQIEENV